MTDTPAPAANRLTILVLGGNGFVGAHLVAALRQAGHRVVRGLRHAPDDDADAVSCDFTRDLVADVWMPRLTGVDIVVNAIGILRESGSNRFDAIHRQAPLAVAKACIAADVRCFVQISSLGNPADGEFIASKHRFDDELSQMPLASVILRPSVVYAWSGSYGGTSLLRALAATALVLPVPGDGKQRMQPMEAEDLGRLVVAIVESVPAPRGMYEVGGPEQLGLRDYLLHWRRWLRIDGERVLPVPLPLVAMGIWLAERFGKGPMGKTVWQMLVRGNVCEADALTRLQHDFRFRPRSLEQVLGEHPSQVQDRWRARLYPFVPILSVAMALVWIVSGLVGLLTSPAQIELLAAHSLLGGMHPVGFARACGVLDLVLGSSLLFGLRTRQVVLAMLISVLAYTLLFGVLLPALWFDPLGGLLKNLIVLPALIALFVLLDRR
ncbi:MAG TPA: SDR family oxidoreductase [Xanthomonadaceae bacterium]|nr:SDR family oxidoreductase [Xanthomonadaceae bacterium]